MKICIYNLASFHCVNLAVMSDIPLNDVFFSAKSSSEEKSSTMKFFRLRVKNKTFKNDTHTNYSENDPHIEPKN